MKKYKEFINESMGYTDFFGKKVSHEDALHKSIRDYIVNIMMDDLHISEKSFKEVDNVIEKVKNICNKNPEIYEQAEEYYQSQKRLNLLAEKIYDEYFKNLNESVSNDIKGKDNEYDNVEEKVENSKKLPKEMKEKILPLIVKSGIHGTKYKEGRVFRLRYDDSKGCDLGADKDGFFVFTHRARSKSYPEIDKIPQKDIKFIESTG